MLLISVAVTVVYFYYVEEENPYFERDVIVWLNLYDCLITISALVSFAETKSEH